jgi:GT2 family glycosyltransferase
VAALSVAAIVVSHERADYLLETLSQLSNQTHFIEQVIVVETSSDQACLDVVSNFDYSVITPGDIRLGAAIEAGISALAKKPGWIWVLHEDSAPEVNALAHLARAAEISPSVAVIGPKLLNWENPIEIQQMGLTLTRTGRPFLLVQKEYDQGQHDAAGDTLAVSTAGMLVSLSAWEKLGGLNDKTPVFAQDLEFGAKARAAGFRVIVDAGARVRHAGLSMRSGRSRKWLGGTWAQGISRAHIHMATLTFPLLSAMALYLLMPLIALISIPKNLLSKRPARIIGQLSGWLWAWGTAPKRFAARVEFRKLGSAKPLRSLYATRPQQKRRRAQKLQEEPLGDPRAIQATIFSSNSIWLALIPLLASFKIFPVGAIVTGNLAPLGSSALAVFEATGISRLPFLSGVALPSDPFNWYLALIAWIWPSNPSLTLAIAIFMSPAFSFLGVWLLSSIFISKIWVRNLIALGFSLSPFALGLALEGQIVELTALNSAIWAAFFLIRSSIAANSARSWRWVGLAGLALGVTAVSSPLLFGLLALLIVGLGFRFWRKSAFMIWALLPGIALIAPWALVIGQSGWLFFTTSTAAALPIGQDAAYLMIVFLALGAGSLLVARLSVVVPIFVFAILSFAGCWLQPASSGVALMGFSALCLSVATGLLLDNLNGRVVTSIIAGATLIGSIGSAALLVNASNGFDIKDPRQLPALVVAAAEQSDSVRTLVLSFENGAVAEVIWGDGRSLEERSVLLDFLSPADQKLQPTIAELAARLVAGNANGVSELVEAAGINFVLLADADSVELAAIASGINSIPSFQPAGNTPFGSLWSTGAELGEARGTEPNNQRNLQLGLIAAFVLLAIPTRASVIGSKKTKRSAS